MTRKVMPVFRGERWLDPFLGCLREAPSHGWFVWGGDIAHRPREGAVSTRVLCASTRASAASALRVCTASVRV